MWKCTRKPYISRSSYGCLIWVLYTDTICGRATKGKREKAGTEMRREGEEAFLPVVAR